MPTKIRGKKESARSVKDPVCGADLDPKVSIHEQREGRDYYFCSEECRDKFSENPSDYSAA